MEEVTHWNFFAPLELECTVLQSLTLKQLMRLMISSKATQKKVHKLLNITIADLVKTYRYLQQYHKFLLDEPVSVIFHGISAAEIPEFIKLITKNDAISPNFFNRFFEQQQNLLNIKDIGFYSNTNPFLLFKLLRNYDQELRRMTDDKESQILVRKIKSLVILGLLSAPVDLILFQFLYDYFLIYDLEKIFRRVVGKGRALLSKYYLACPVRENIRYMLMHISLQELLDYEELAILVTYKALPEFSSQLSSKLDLWDLLANSYISEAENKQAYWRQYRDAVKILLQTISGIDLLNSTKSHHLMEVVLNNTDCSNVFLKFLVRKCIAKEIKYEVLEYLLSGKINQKQIEFANYIFSQQLLHAYVSQISDLNIMYFIKVDTDKGAMPLLKVLVTLCELIQQSSIFNGIINLFHEEYVYSMKDGAVAVYRRWQNLGKDLHASFNDKYFLLKFKRMQKNCGLANMVILANSFKSITNQSDLSFLLGLPCAVYNQTFFIGKKMDFMDLQSVTDEYNSEQAVGRKFLCFSM